MSDSVTPRIAAHQASLSFPISCSLLKLVFIVSVMPFNPLILCHPLHFLPSVFPSIRVFANESALCIRWPKDWSFSFSLSPSNEYSVLTSFRFDWFDLLNVQGTLMFSPVPQFWKHQFFGPQFFLWSNSHMDMNKPYSREGERQETEVLGQEPAWSINRKQGVQHNRREVTEMEEGRRYWSERWETRSC